MRTSNILHLGGKELRSLARDPVMLAAPTTHFVMLAQAILYRGAGLEVVWRQFVVLFAIGAALFAYALARFRATVGTMA